MNTCGSVREVLAYVIARYESEQMKDPRRHLIMEDKPLSPKWFIQAMAILAIAGMTLPLVAGLAGFIKNEIMRPAAIERTT